MNGLACRQTTSVLAGRSQGYVGRCCLPLSRWCSLTSPSPRGVGLNAMTILRLQQVRGKKTRSSMRLEDLPQGPIKMDVPPPPPTPAEDEGPAYPTVVLQARHNMQKFENCVLLTRVGGFYELYFDQAEEYGPMLNLKVAQKKTNAGPVPMAGFPFFQLDRFLKTLVLDLNSYVAIAEEFPNDPGDKIKANGLMHDRRVTRVITPGTLIDENFIDPYANNYVMAVHINHQGNDTSNSAESDTPGKGIVEAEGLAALQANDTPIGLAWIDVSTGQFYTQSTTVTSLGSILSRVGPREVVMDEVFESQSDHQLFSVLAEDKYLITFAPHSEQLPLSEWTPMLESDIPTQTAQDFTPDEVQAGSLLLQYVRDRLQGLSMKLQPPLRYENMSVMAIDKSTMRSLEIKQTIRDGTFRGSLLHAIRRTVTKGGARLLNTWLSAPSTSLETIKARQDLVEYFIQHPDLRDEIVLLLRRSHDSQRLVQKFALGRGDPDDLISLANTIQATQHIVSFLKAAKGQDAFTIDSNDAPEEEQQNSTSGASCFTPLLSRIKLKEPVTLATRIKNSIDEEGLVQQHRDEDSEASHLISLAEDVVASEGARGAESAIPKTTKKKKQAASLRDHYSDDNTAFVMKPDASRGLRSLHAKLSTLLEEKHVLEETLRERFGAASLTLKWTPNLGHVCHVKGTKDLRKLDADDESKTIAVVSSSRSTRAFHAPEWTALGRRIHQTRFEVGVEEQRLFADLRALVVANLVKLRRNAAVLDELDVAASFAKLAAEHGWTRPVLHDTSITSASNITSTSTSTSPIATGTAQHIVLGGRHPTVEAGLREQGRSFTKNDCLLDANPLPSSPSPPSSPPTSPPSSHGRLHLITGPNMAGKSTYLRQNALLVILSQIGSWVPATYASLPVTDAVFSRVGSADNLFADQSTFMVEMLETAAILRAATARSFVIMDEIGRGTTPEDGGAVAFAALHHIVVVNRCRALFATHYHGLADLVEERDMQASRGGAVETYCTDVQEDSAGGFVYIHRLRKGVNRQSHALKVARLAGLPEAAIKVAREVLEKRGRKDNHTGQEEDMELLRNVPAEQQLANA
ncbi:muts domain V-domain-containing protein [Annulohypoxylon maeteangense]|uniref:muts domain V-domain-containing protein n=1 Tax=Annulohypoxylon maeteangense TaxID=1927788 RepID=UPI002008014A|nr:muts domain V-domain-containing protein [Annulohypoxylon maeteangense]KAI0889960.1 muts domain V-domain-containing protein [Annulohypoxylon maeteangense]